MRLGGSIPMDNITPEKWVYEAKRIGYKASTFPVNGDVDSETAREYMRAATEADLLIAEVGAWCNPLSLDDKERAYNMSYIKKCLATAEEIGANCCVNIAGARGEVWDGGYADNYMPDTYALIVDSVREIIDAVKPTRTFYTLEPMPWMVPDSVDCYLQLIKDIDRPAFAVHLDFVNMMNTPQKFLQADVLLEDCLRRLGPYIRSVHLKDAAMDVHKMPCQILECAPGQGTLDFAKLLGMLNCMLPKDMPVLLEHMWNIPDYERAYNYLSGIAAANSIPV